VRVGREGRMREAVNDELLSDSAKCVDFVDDARVHVQQKLKH
jgi:hypothetical protein